MSIYNNEFIKSQIDKLIEVRICNLPDYHYLIDEIDFIYSWINGEWLLGRIDCDDVSYWFDYVETNVLKQYYKMKIERN